MSAITDVLLKPTVSSSQAGPNAPAADSATTEPFAEVYAAQRKPADKAQSKHDNDQAGSTKESEESATGVATDAGEAPEALADNGNALPLESDQQAAPLVELLQSPLWAWVQENQIIEMQDPSLGHAWVAQVAADEVEIDPKVLSLNSAQTTHALLEKTTQAPMSLTFSEALFEAEPELDDALLGELGSKLEGLMTKASAQAVEPANDPNARANPLLALTTSAPLAAAARPSPVVPGQGLSLQPSGLSEAVVDRVMWMSSQNLKSAQIQLDPAELGRLDVRVNIQGEQTQVIFASAHASVRDALEAQMQRLRELFTQQGMTQPEVSVADRSGQDAGRSFEGTPEREMHSGQDTDESNLEGAETQLSQALSGTGLVDYYA